MSGPGREHAGARAPLLLAPLAQVAVEEERVLIRAGEAAVVLEGAAAVQLLPALLPLLDGTRTAAGIEAAFGAAATPAVRNALGVLAAHGLLADGPAAAGPPGVVFPALAGAAAGLGHGVPAQVAAALATRTVAVTGDGAVAGLVAALLAASGPCVEHVAGSGPGSAQQLPEAVDLVVVAPARAGRGLLADLDQELRGRGRPWLAVPGLDGTRALVGPIVVPGASCCWHCVQQRRATASGFGDAWDALAAAPGPDLAGAAAALVAGVAAQVALCALVDGIGVAVPAGVVWSIELAPEPALSRHVVHRVPRCPSCSPAVALPERLPWQPASAA